ncbi:hypothetical protein BJX61DRAFT_506452 [Aspergillus egyptiacus]|nr:hypothetical protein BJX61DRAFT_506452 [Aspergillus egyptiacus]
MSISPGILSTIGYSCKLRYRSRPLQNIWRSDIHPAFFKCKGLDVNPHRHHRSLCSPTLGLFLFSHPRSPFRDILVWSPKLLQTNTQPEMGAEKPDQRENKNSKHGPESGPSRNSGPLLHGSLIESSQERMQYDGAWRTNDIVYLLPVACKVLGAQN